MARKRLPLIDGIADVAERQLCAGCGVCASVQPDDIRMVDDLDAGRRPVVRTGPDGTMPSTEPAMACCPGIGLEHGEDPLGAIPELRATWGPVLEVWEGHAGAADIRCSGSSGGAATALALDAMQEEKFYGTLHIRSRSDTPYLNETVLSRTRDQLLFATGSRYAPASPCDRLDLVRSAPAPCIFIGKPCDVAATAMVRRFDPVLDRQLGLTIAIFCAGTPTTRGTLEMLRVMGVEDPEDLATLRYRGLGWPGKAWATWGDEADRREASLTYDESWGDILERHRQWRCYVCADHTGEFADIAVGDPWYRELRPDEPGRSLIVVRTERGRRRLAAALASGAIVAERVPAQRVEDSQPGLLQVRGSVWGRIAASRLAGIPAPRYRGLPMFHVWLRLSTLEKLRSTLGLFRRIKRRGLRQRHPVNEHRP